MPTFYRVPTEKRINGGIGCSPHFSFTAAPGTMEITMPTPADRDAVPSDLHVPRPTVPAARGVGRRG